MPNKLPFVFRKTWESDLTTVVAFTHKVWGARQVRNLETELEKALHQIKSNHQRYPIVTELEAIPPVRKKLLFKQLLILYQVFEDHILILGLFDTRQNPKKLSQYR